MVLFNYSTKELTAKVVYYGPGLCGKTTNLQWIHEKLPIKNKGKMLSLATETDRTLFFDFLPIEIGTIRGMKTRIQLYTVPGQVFYNATRRMVLKGADAVCFVCDSQEAMLDANLESYENMRQNLEANEIDPDEIPVVLQYNKRDLPNALPIEILNERMNPHNYPFYEAIAVRGAGVENTLKAVTKLVFKSLSAKYGDGAAASPPGRAPGPPRSTPPPQPFTPGPPLAVSAEDPLGELDLSQPEPSAPAVAADLPPIEFDEERTPVGSAFPEPSRAPISPPPRVTPAPPARPATPGQPSRPPIPQSRAPIRQSLPPLPPSRPPIPPSRPPIEPSRPPVAAHRPQNTLVSRQDEAEELRRRIASPGLSEDVEMDLEEIDDFDHPTHASFVPPSPLTDTTAPEPQMRPEAAGTTEVEVPIDIEIAPGTTRISLNIKLQLNLRRR
jgi:signal recognition particle receptor subunit beta